jgi:hypothetical protein
MIVIEVDAPYEVYLLLKVSLMHQVLRKTLCKVVRNFFLYRVIFYDLWFWGSSESAIASRVRSFSELEAS